MDENDKFALVPKTPAAIEKAEPGTNRVLSGMVGDVLDLARKKEIGEVASVNLQLLDWFLTGLKYEMGQDLLDQDPAKASDYELLAVFVGPDLPGPRNLSEAVKWYRKAAEGGFADAQHKLGLCYIEGKGVTADEAEAVKWFRKAAEQNHAEAQCKLGICYEFGRGVPVDVVEAYKLYKLVADNLTSDDVPDEDQETIKRNQETIKGNLERIAAQMTTVEIAEAERRIRDFKAVHLVKKEVESKPINSGDFGALNVPCPKCGGEVRDDYTMLQCTKCDFSLLKIVAGRQMEVSEVEDLIATKHVGPLDGFHDEKGNAFSASLKLNDAFKVEFDFGKNDER